MPRRYFFLFRSCFAFAFLACSIRSRWRSSASTCRDQNRRNGSSHTSNSCNGSGLSRYKRRCASTVDSTNPASRSTRRCFETVGCDIRSWRSISPTDCSEETSRLRIARRFGSAMTSNIDSTLSYILHIEYTCQGIYWMKFSIPGLGSGLEAPDLSVRLRPVHSEDDPETGRIDGFVERHSSKACRNQASS